MGHRCKLFQGGGMIFLQRNADADGAQLRKDEWCFPCVLKNMQVFFSVYSKCELILEQLINKNSLASSVAHDGVQTPQAAKLKNHLGLEILRQSASYI